MLPERVFLFGEERDDLVFVKEDSCSSFFRINVFERSVECFVGGIGFNSAYFSESEKVSSYSSNSF